VNIIDNIAAKLENMEHSTNAQYVLLRTSSMVLLNTKSLWHKTALSTSLKDNLKQSLHKMSMKFPTLSLFLETFSHPLGGGLTPPLHAQERMPKMKKMLICDICDEYRSPKKLSGGQRRVLKLKSSTYDQ
jgi:hypothetical protein